MKKLNLKKELRNIAGKIVFDEVGKPLMLHEIVAECLPQGNSGNATKMMSICIRLVERGEVELDDSDIEFFKVAVKNCRTATDLVLAQVHKEIDMQLK